jgi:hypothetical protein
MAGGGILGGGRVRLVPGQRLDQSEPFLGVSLGLAQPTGAAGGDDHRVEYAGEQHRIARLAGRGDGFDGQVRIHVEPALAVFPRLRRDQQRGDAWVAGVGEPLGLAEQVGGPLCGQVVQRCGPQPIGSG